MDKRMLKREFSSFGIQIDDDQADKFILFYDELVEWNKKFNLTRIVDDMDVIQKHFLDSLIARDIIGQNCADIGSGSGFPAIPLLILDNKIKYLMIDSSNKRVKFLNHIIQLLNLNATAIHARAEDLGKDSKYRERFDSVTSRAVAPLNIIAEHSSGLVKVGGSIIMYKGPGALDEIKDNKLFYKLSLGDPQIKSYSYEWGERKLIINKKINKLNVKLPRARAIIEKSL